MNKKMKFGTKLGYGIGDFGGNLIFTTAGSFLTLYYTDSVLLSAAFVGTMMLVSRLLDGVSDIIMGIIIDHTNKRSLFPLEKQSALCSLQNTLISAVLHLLPTGCF